MAVSISELGQRFPEELSDRDEGVELFDFVDYAVEREVDRHPELPSRRKKLIFIQETFGLNSVEIANWLGITEKESRRYLSRRGIRDNEFEEIKDRFEHVFTITSMVNRHVEGLNSKRKTLIKPNALLRNLGVKDWIIEGKTRRAVAVAERTFRHIHE
ncbi:MAG: hypothetical protein COU25_01810 [Candidatus Levybacteria bacterium CG10_big_fil_rev_8_21_14_0_10_35_13]|nr:MAG: hypothetical protein COU25_01810 [Candidatus Levybacteria bacterium CG10_big_fil_rev_8_21_14_0_10_35_13]